MSRPLRVVLIVLIVVVLAPFAVIGLALLGHWSSERPQVALINRSLKAAEHDLRGVATVVHSHPAEARAFVCCGDGGPSGDLELRGADDLAGTVRAVHEALVAAGWTITDATGHPTRFRATRGSLEVDVDVFTMDATTARYDPAFAPGEVQVALTAR